MVLINYINMCLFYIKNFQSYKNCISEKVYLSTMIQMIFMCINIKNKNYDEKFILLKKDHILQIISQSYQ